MAQGKIRIRLKGYDHQQLDRSAQQIVDTAQRTGATITGPVPLPTEKNVYCVIRSPFKDKDSREHFEIRTHKRLIDIHSPTPKTVDSLMRLDLHLDVVARHDHLDTLGEVGDTGHVGGAEVELRPVAVEERRVAPALVLGEDVDLAVEVRVRRDRARLCEHLAALDVLALDTAEECTGVVACVREVE